MLRPRKSVAKPKPAASHVERSDKRQHHQETFATPTLTTITESGAHRFNYDGLNVFLSCHRTFDANRIQEVFPRNRIPALVHTLDILGVHLNCNERLCSITPIAGQKLEIGKRYHHFLLKYNNREMLASVSLEIQSVTKPCAARFTRNVAMQAAFALHRTQIERANQALYEEIERLVNIYAEKTNAAAQPPQSVEKAVNKPSKNPVRRSFRLGAS